MTASRSRVTRSSLPAGDIDLGAEGHHVKKLLIVPLADDERIRIALPARGR